MNVYQSTKWYKEIARHWVKTVSLKILINDKESKKAKSPIHLDLRFWLQFISVTLLMFCQVLSSCWPLQAIINSSNSRCSKTNDPQKHSTVSYSKGSNHAAPVSLRKSGFQHELWKSNMALIVDACFDQGLQVVVSNQ